MVAYGQPPDVEQNTQAMPQFRTSEGLAQLQAMQAHQVQDESYQALQFNGNNVNVASNAYMYGAPLASPSMANNSFTTLNSFGTNFYNPHVYPVQSYGFAQHHQLGAIYEHGVNAGVSAPSHVTVGNSQASQVFVGLSCPWQLPDTGVETPERHHDGRTVKEQAWGIKDSHRRLYAVVESDDPPDPPHESSPPSAATMAASPNIRGGTETGKRGIGTGMPRFAKGEQDAPIDTKSNVRTGRCAPEQHVLVGVDKPMQRHKRRKPKRSTSQRKPTSHVDSSEPQPSRTRHEPRGTTPIGSDANATAEVEYHFDEKAFTVENGIARKMPRVQKLRISLPDPSGAEHSTPGPTLREGNNLGTNNTHRCNAASKKRTKSNIIPKPDTKDSVSEIPEKLRDRKQPQTLTDLLDLVEFETASYNNSSQRQIEFEPVNGAITRENAARDVRAGTLQRRLTSRSEAKVIETDSPAARPTRSGVLKPKRKADGIPPGDICASKPKARKTGRTNKQLVAEQSDGDIPARLLTEQTELEKMQFVPKEMRFLTKRIERCDMGHLSLHGMEPGGPQQTSIAEAEYDNMEPGESTDGVDDVDSTLDAEGETDEDTWIRY